MLPAVIEVYAATCAVSLKSDRLMSPSRLSPYPSNLKPQISNLFPQISLPVISSGVEKSSGTMLLTVSEAYATSHTVNLKSGRLTI